MFGSSILQTVSKGLVTLYMLPLALSPGLKTSRSQWTYHTYHPWLLLVCELSPLSLQSSFICSNSWCEARTTCVLWAYAWSQIQDSSTSWGEVPSALWVETQFELSWPAAIDCSQTGGEVTILCCVTVCYWLTFVDELRNYMVSGFAGW